MTCHHSAPPYVLIGLTALIVAGAVVVMSTLLAWFL